jgi:hypothetical protein
LQHAAKLYGERVHPLCLGEDPATVVQRILGHYADYRALAMEIGAALAREHSYETRIAELLSFAG